MVLAWIKGRKTLKYMIKKRYKKGKLEREARGIKKKKEGSLENFCNSCKLFWSV
jgi:hypothetical protein